nr:hypothetical protein HmN_000518900 [Hymenolepis microstoma]
MLAPEFDRFEKTVECVFFMAAAFPPIQTPLHDMLKLTEAELYTSFRVPVLTICISKKLKAFTRNQNASSPY